MATETYSFDQGFAGGLRIDLTPDRIPPSSSPDMENVNYDGAIPNKRNGFTRITATSWGATPIRGTFEFYMIGVAAPIFLVAHGGKIYKYVESTDTKTSLCTGTVTAVTDAPTTFFQVRDKCFIMTGTEYLYYDGVNPIATVQSIAHIPTIVLTKKPDGTGGLANEKFNHLSDKWKESFDGNGVTTEYVVTKQLLPNGLTPITLSTNLFKAYIYEVEMTEGAGFTFNRTTWKATFSVAPASGIDNVQIQLEADALMDQTLITKCDKAIEYGGKNNSVVFIAGNPAYPNVARYCWFYDPTYWPQDADISVGNDARAITGWGRMNDYLVTYKQPGDEFVQWYSELELDTAGTVSVATNGLNDEFGCIAHRTVHPAQNGLLALSDRGVTWTWPSLVKGQANCKIISQGVNGKNGIANGILDNTKADLALAHAEVSGNKYLLHIKDKVWVLDLEYSDLANGIYCWYPYTGIFAKAGVFFIRDTVLYIGDKAAGMMYKETPLNYSDDGVIIDAWWTSPLMFLGGRNWIKEFSRIRLTFKVGAGNQHTLTFITDQGPEDIVITQQAGVFSASSFNAEFFIAGVENPDYPTTQPEKIGYKGQYLQFKVRNNMANRGLTMLAAEIDYSPLKKIK